MKIPGPIPGQFRVGVVSMAIGIFLLWDNFSGAAPLLSELAPVTLPLSGKIGLVRPQKDEKLYASVPLGIVQGQITNICEIWQCRIPEEVAALNSGDVVQVWIKERQIWQLSSKGKILLKYSDVYSIHEYWYKRGYYMPFFFSAFGALLLLAGTLAKLSRQRANAQT
jgi:hypothetical protein